MTPTTRTTPTRRTLQARLDALQFDFSQYTFERFRQHISHRRGRELYLFPWSMPPGVFGVWLTSSDYPHEYIFFEQALPAVHQHHVQLHELAHFLCGHATTTVDRRRLADISRHGLERVALRARPVDRQSTAELEAETLALLIQERVVRARRLEALTEASSQQFLADYLADWEMV